MKMFKYFIAGGLILFSSLGCKKYLSEEPKKQTTIQTVEQLEALINNATAFTYDGNNATAAYSTDDTEIPLDAYKNYPVRWSVENLYSYVFNVDQLVGLAADPLWNGEYKKIFTANLILSYLDKVSGNESDKAKVKADAHFIRAYSYWLLANHYCLPYSQANENAPGLPLKKSVDYTEALSRASLKETYAFIEADLAEAAKTPVQEVDPRKTWRVSQKAVQAFLSRYHLFLGNYDKSLDNANKALETQAVQLFDYKAMKPGNVASYTNPSASLAYSEFNDWATAQFLYWKEFYYARYSYTSSQWWLPSNALMSLFDKQNDLRYKWLMMENGGRRFSVINPSLARYSFFNDGRYIPTGPTIAEVLLNKAEVQARKSDIGGAMQTLKTLQDQRLQTSTLLTATDKDDAIKKVLEERRREMPFAMRWFDIRRFSVNDYAADDVTIQRTFYKVGVGTVDVNVIENYTLPSGSKRYAVPINGVEMDASRGQINQNTY